MALGSQSGRQIGQGRFMYRRRKGRPGRWLAVLLIICGLGGIYWMTRTGPSSLQADGEDPTVLTLDGGAANETMLSQGNTTENGAGSVQTSSDGVSFEDDDFDPIAGRIDADIAAESPTNILGERVTW